MDKWMITAAVLIAASPAYAQNAPSADLPCAIVLDLLNMRAGPGMNYPVVNQLRPGNIVSVIDGFINGWQRVQIYEGDGWVFANYIKPVECPPPPENPVGDHPPQQVYGETLGRRVPEFGLPAPPQRGTR